MTETDTIFNRIGRFFKRSTKSEESASGDGQDSQGGVSESASASPSNGALVEVRSTLRPWARNTAAISQLQEGFQSLNDLMGAIRDNMESQGRRQDEMLAHLSALPKMLETIPENNRLQAETLKAIHEQLQHQSDQQQVLGEILGKIGDAGGDQREALNGVRDRVESLHEQDKAVADTLHNLGSVLESATRNSAASTEVLGQMRDNWKTRDSDLERVLHRQSTRFTTMLAIAILLSIAALVAVVIMGYLMLHAPPR